MLCSSGLALICSKPCLSIFSPEMSQEKRTSPAESHLTSRMHLDGQLFFAAAASFAVSLETSSFTASAKPRPFIRNTVGQAATHIAQPMHPLPTTYFIMLYDPRSADKIVTCLESGLL